MLSGIELGVLAFASYRGAQFLVHDSLLDKSRKRLEMWHAVKFESRARSFVRDLIACTYCTGFWVSVIAVLVYLTVSGQWGDSPFLVHAIEAWAVAGGQALLNRIDDTLPVRGDH